MEWKILSLMLVEQFDFSLPEDLIALRPKEPRETANLLHVKAGQRRGFSHNLIDDLPEFLRAGDCLLFNDSKVIPAALQARKTESATVGKIIHLNLLTEDTPGIWQAFARPGRALKVGTELSFIPRIASRALPCGHIALTARVSHKYDDGRILLDFSLPAQEVFARLADFGHMPLPPYIVNKRAADRKDDEDYQPIFARHAGAVASPTASLHFTPQLMEKLHERAIEHCFITLHVGAGTFLPVKAKETQNHIMHAEWGEISQQTADKLNDIRHKGGRILCIGTTSLRLLETATTPCGDITAFLGNTDIFITPGYPFKAADMLLTNFHLPRSTLFMLISAFIGLEAAQAAYAYAIQERFRFYSYGDACLLERKS